ncbi:MAG: DUF1592 domain-containing protein [Chthoniobacteraceae bacterium]
MRITTICLLALAAALPARALDYEREIKPVLMKFCADCHSAEKMKGDFDMTKMLAKPDLAADHDAWEMIAELMLNREMPPESKPQPDDGARTKVIEWVEGELHKLAAKEPPNPGRVTIRRLNREEYRHTIRDLLGVDFNPEDFPADEVGYGFNNIGDVLSLSPMLLEKYLAAAEEIVRKTIVAEAPKPPKRRMRGDQFGPHNEWIRALDNHALGLYREGEAGRWSDFIRTGEYAVRVRAYAEPAGPDAPKLALKLGGKTIATFDVGTEKPKTYEARITAKAGWQELSVAFLNNYHDTTNTNPKLRGDRNVFVESVEIEGPFDGKPEPAVRVVDLSKWKLPDGASKGQKEIGFSSSGEARAEWQFPEKDEYLIRIRAHGDRGGDELPKARVALDGTEIGVFEVKAKEGQEDARDFRVTIEAGKHVIGVAFMNDYYEPATNQDRNLIVHAVEVIGPINNAALDLPESHRRLITRMPARGEEAKVAKEIIGRFAERAYRRNVADAEVARLVKFVDLSLANGGSFLEGVQAAVQAALCSPHFLYRWELDPSALKAGDVRNLGDFEIASRLSYFLWSSMPDAELFDLAKRGALLKDGNLEKQVARMLKDGRTRALVENFGGQWLQLHNIYDIDPDPKKFPKFSHELREDMKRETLAFVESIVKEDRSVLDLIDARFTFLNERLARHYGVDGVKGNDFRRVELPADSPRGGVLTMGSVLLATSQPTRTSPVIRGKWILEQILGTPPPPPPPNVPPLEAKHIDPNLPIRKRLEIHRDNPDCAGCHAKIDPLGYALENFDAIGAFRTMDGAAPVDASGKLPNGTEFKNAADLKRMIRGDKFVHSLAEQMTIYALGRGLQRYDKAPLSQIVSATKAGDYRFSSLVLAIVKSDPFLKRKTEEGRVAAN